LKGEQVVSAYAESIKKNFGNIPFWPLDTCAFDTIFPRNSGELKAGKK